MTLPEDTITILAARIKQKVQELRADGVIGMSKGNLKQVVNLHGLSFANPYHFENSFSEALQRAKVRKFVL